MESFKICPNCKNEVEIKSDHISDIQGADVLITCYIKYCPACLEVIESTINLSK